MHEIPALDLPYAPFVLAAGRVYEGRNAERVAHLAEADHYCLWTAITGRLRLSHGGRSEPLPAGGSVLLPPRSGWSIRIAPADVAAGIDFDVVWRPRQRRQGSEARDAAADGSQPDPRRLWNCAIPVPLPKAQWPQARRIQELVVRQWWLSPIEHLRTNAELGLWMAQLVQALLPEHDRNLGDIATPLERAEAHARELLYRASVASMAEAAGMPQSSFSECYQRARGRSPGAFLDELRLAAALRRVRAGEWPLPAIARWVGWRKVETLRRHFRRELGAAPEDFRPERLRGRRAPAR